MVPAAMSKLRDFRRRLQQIERRTSPRRTTVEEHFTAPARRDAARTESAVVSAVRKRVGAAHTRASVPAHPVALDEACPGTAITDQSGGIAYLITPAPGAVEQGIGELHALFVRGLRAPDSPVRSRVSRATGVEEPRAEQMLFMDIETTGLGSTPLFLIGVMTVEDDAFAIRQYLARDYTEEPAVLRSFIAEMEAKQMLVTFNGKSFDMPYIRTRAAYHRLDALSAPAHFDLLHECRRIWRGELPNCRLQTLESRICGRSRHDDIEGADIPDAYHDFVRTGDASDIVLIAKHNALDLLTMADLMVRMPAV